MEDSLYSQFESHEAPVIEQERRAENWQANREDNTKPYVNDQAFQAKVANAPTDNAPKTTCNYEWMLFICNRDTVNIVAREVNRSFTRNNLTGSNFDSEKVRYFNLYKEELTKLK